jgi:hypothetical protein
VTPACPATSQLAHPPTHPPLLFCSALGLPPRRAAPLLLHPLCSLLLFALLASFLRRAITA